MAKGLKTLVLMIAVFMMFVLPAQAEVQVSVQSNLEPASPKTADSLSCKFTVTGNQSSYDVDLEWSKAGSVVASDNLTASNGTEVTRPLSQDIKKNDVWLCQVKAEDNSGNQDTGQTNQVTVQNTAPTMSNIGGRNVNTLETLSFTPNVNDPDVSDGIDSLTYSISNAPNGMSINSNNGRITWEPLENQTGTYNNIQVSATDGSASDSKAFSVTVKQMKLAIDDLDVECSPDCDDNLDEEDGGTIEEVRPGSTLELQIDLENLWDDDVDDHDIEDVEIIGTLEDIGDEDEQEEEEDIDKIDPGDSESVTLKFDIPRDADEDTYDLDLEITGEDEDGTDYSIDLEIEVEVEKEDDEIIFDRADLQPTTITCNRDIELRVRVKNIGSDDQDDAELVVRNSQLEISENDFFDIEEGDYDDDDTEFERTYNFQIADSVDAGTYQIELRAYYEDQDEYERTLLPLTVRDCEPATPDDDEEEEQQEEEEEVEVIENQQPPTQTQGPQVAQPVTETTDSVESFMESNAFIAVLAVAFIILLIAVIVLAVVAFRR